MTRFVNRLTPLRQNSTQVGSIIRQRRHKYKAEKSATTSEDDVNRDGSPSYHKLSKIIQSLKRHTATECNRLLGRVGTFWHAESYDHVVRDIAEWRRIVRYVIDNPVKAGLVDEWQQWPFSYCAYL